MSIKYHIYGLLVLLCCLGQPLPAATEMPITIAAIYARTGVGAVHDEPNFQGIHIAVQHINAHGGILGRPLQVLEIDNQSTPLGSRQAAIRAIEMNVTAVIGSSWSSNSLAIAPILQEKGVPMISSISTSPAVTRDRDYVFRVCFTDPFQGHVMAQFSRQYLKADTAALLVNMNSVYSQGLAAEFDKAFQAMGGKIVWRGDYQEEALEFTEQLQAIANAQPAVVYLPGYMRDSGFVIRQAQSMGLKLRFLGGDGWQGLKMYNYGHDAIDGNYFTMHWHQDVKKSASQEFVKDYQQTYQQPVTDSTAALAYDAVMLLADAIKRADSTDRKAIRDAIAQTTGFKGVTGVISMDKQGNPVGKDAVILQFANKNVVFVQQVKNRAK